MIISNSSIGMDSARTYTSVSMNATYQGRITKATFLDSLNLKKDASKASETEEESEETVTTDSEEARKSFDDIFNSMKSFATSGALERKMELDSLNKIKVQCIQYLLMLLFGRDPTTCGTKDLVSENISNSLSSGEGTQIGYTKITNTNVSFSAESERTSFSTNGTVVTADGRNININLEVSMSRSFAIYAQQTSSWTTAYIDPLVINIDSDCATVSDLKVSFDLDCDGQMESINTLGPGSGYLSLDLNGDGIINDGSELFGTKSGDGFADLAKYDSDGNGWIDEADDIFDKLKICVQASDGSQTLYSLKDKEVGAIYLGNKSTDFSLNSLETNENYAQIRSTGIFLYENGNAGTLQHLDLAQ